MHQFFNPAIDAVIITGIFAVISTLIKRVSDIQVAKLNNEPSFSQQLQKAIDSNRQLERQNNQLIDENEALKHDIKQLKFQISQLSERLDNLNGGNKHEEN